MNMYAPVSAPDNGPWSRFEDCTVTSVTPLLVQRDGDSSIELEAVTLIDPSLLLEGDRVRVEFADERLIIHGAFYIDES